MDSIIDNESCRKRNRADDDENEEDSADRRRVSLSPPERRVPVQMLLDKLKCPVCFEIIPSPIEQCSNGHLICSSCYGQLNPALPKECPQCHVDMTSPARNLTLEQMASSWIVPCRYSGCTEQVLYSNLSSHIKSCEYRPVQCQKCKEMCTNWDKLWEHFKEDHPNYYNDNKFHDEVCNSVDANKMNDLLNARNSLPYLAFFVNMVDDSGLNVRFFPFILYRKIEKSFYFGIMEMGPPHPENCYELTVTSGTISGRQKKLTMSPIQAISYRVTKKKDIFKSENAAECMCVNVDALKRISNNFTQELNFKIRAIKQQEEAA